MEDMDKAFGYDRNAARRNPLTSMSPDLINSLLKLLK
jgi:hypothetical protein